MANTGVENQPPVPQATEPRGTRAAAAGVGAAIGAAVTVPAMIIFAISGGLVGHGDYVVARLIFPIPMLLVAMAPDYLTGSISLLYLLQFPIYGALLGMGTRLSVGILAVLLALHIFAAIASFTELAFLF